MPELIRELLVISVDTTVTELTEAIAHMVTESRKIEHMIAEATDYKAADVYRLRWDRLAERIEALCDEVRERVKV